MPLHQAEWVTFEMYELEIENVILSKICTFPPPYSGVMKFGWGPQQKLGKLCQ